MIVREMQDGQEWFDIVRMSAGYKPTRVGRKLERPKALDTPDSIQPLVAFKYLSPRSDGTLESPLYQQAWVPGKSVVAKCQYTHTHPSGESVPTAGCNCGIHAVDEDSSQILRVSVDHTAVAALYLWGDIAHHERGYRAQYAEIAVVLTSSAVVRKTWAAAGVPVIEPRERLLRSDYAVLRKAREKANERYRNGDWSPGEVLEGGSGDGNYIHSFDSSYKRYSGSSAIGHSGSSVNPHVGGYTSPGYYRLVVPTEGDDNVTSFLNSNYPNGHSDIKHVYMQSAGGYYERKRVVFVRGVGWHLVNE